MVSFTLMVDSRHPATRDCNFDVLACPGFGFIEKSFVLFHECSIIHTEIESPGRCVCSGCKKPRIRIVVCVT